jgi:hypothetical protein
MIMLAGSWFRRSTCLFSIVLFAGTCALPTMVVADDEAENLESLRGAIDRAIELLEADDYETYIEEFYSVEEYRRLRTGRRLTDEARHLAALPGFKDRMLTAFRAARESEPRWSNEAGVARFSINLTELSEPADPAETTAPVVEPAVPEVAGWGDDLDQVLTSAIAAIEEEDYATFVEHIFPAAEVVHMKSSDGMDLLLLKLETYPEMAEAMQRDLEECLAAQTSICEEGVAEFTLTEGRDNPQTVKFQLVGGNWRFYDSITPVREEAAAIAAEAGGDGDDILTIELERIGNEWRFVADES